MSGQLDEVIASEACTQIIMLSATSHGGSLRHIELATAEAQQDPIHKCCSSLVWHSHTEGSGHSSGLALNDGHNIIGLGRGKGWWCTGHQLRRMGEKMSSSV